jgi:tetratricopeptide (TPR) repeat protein
MVIVKPMIRLWCGLHVWWRGRPFRALLAGLPALLVGGGVLGTCILGATTPAQEVEARYLERAKTALKARDYPAALTCYDRLAYRGEERPEVLYGLAVCAEALGDGGRAEALMSGLAPADRPGYSPAHLWQARRLLHAPRLSAQGRAEAEAHLVHALDGELDDREAAHALLGEVYLGAGQLDQAQLHLAKAVRTRPYVHLQLARVYARRGDRDRARGEADLAVGYYRARAKADLQDRQARLLWAEAKTFLEDFPAAVGVLDEGWAATHDNAYRTALANVYLVWSDVLGRDPKADLGARLRLLENGLKCDAANLGLLERLLAATRVGGPEADRARSALQGVLARGQAPASVHFALGLDAWQRGRKDEARVHWERALELAPQTPTVANNLAWLLAETDSADLPRALELANFAVERAPNEKSFRDTRGRIFARMGKWREALADLEAALAHSPDNAGLHRALADVYTHLGMPDMAAQHQRLAEEHRADQGPARERGL